MSEGEKKVHMTTPGPSAVPSSTISIKTAFKENVKKLDSVDDSHKFIP